ncbi:hypothetical protein RUND412_007013 [Rhizina undulata]
MSPHGEKMRESIATVVSCDYSVADNDSSISQKLIEECTEKDLKDLNALRELVQSVPAQSLSSGNFIADEHDAGSSFKGGRLSTFVAKQANRGATKDLPAFKASNESGGIKKDGHDPSVHAMNWDSDEDIVMTVNEPKVVEEEKVQPTVTTINKTDDSKTFGAPLGSKLIPTRGGLKPGRGRRGGSRGGAAIEVAALAVFGGSKSNTIAGPSTFIAVTKPRCLRTVRESRRNAKATSKEDLDQLATSSNTRSKSNSFDVDLHNKENDIGWINGLPVEKGRFSQDIVKRVFGNSGTIYTTLANIDDEGLNTQMIDCETYILISPDNHPDCPPDIGKNGFLLDISGAEEIPKTDHDIDFPAFCHDSNSLVYLGNYKFEERKIMAEDDFEGIPQMVRDFWINKI